MVRRDDGPRRGRPRRGPGSHPRAPGAQRGRQDHAALGPVRVGETGEGTVRLFGRTRPELGARWLDGVGGFVETPRFYPYLTGRRNLAVLAGLDGGGDHGQVDELLDLVGLGAAGDRKVQGYSLGMGQRLGLAAALLRRPRLLILDEPTNGMDPAGTRDLRGALRGLADEGLTVILSSHDMAQVEEICDSVTVLSRGRTAFTGDLATMRAEAPDPAWRLRTADDDAAMGAARNLDEIKVFDHGPDGLVVLATQDRLDAYVLHLGRSGIAVRALTLDVTPLASMFFHLTEEPGRPRRAESRPRRSFRRSGS